MHFVSFCCPHPPAVVWGPWVSFLLIHFTRRSNTIHWKSRVPKASCKPLLGQGWQQSVSPSTPSQGTGFAHRLWVHFFLKAMWLSYRLLASKTSQMSRELSPWEKGTADRGELEMSPQAQLPSSLLAAPLPTEAWSHLAQFTFPLIRYPGMVCIPRHVGRAQLKC